MLQILILLMYGYVQSPWAARLGAHMSLEEMMRAEREDRVAKMVREWLRNRAPAQAYHNTLTQIKPGRLAFVMRTCLLSSLC